MIKSIFLSKHLLDLYLYVNFNSFLLYVVGLKGIYKTNLLNKHVIEKKSYNDCFLFDSDQKFNLYASGFNKLGYALSYGHYVELQLQGIGYRAWTFEKLLHLQLGYNDIFRLSNVDKLFVKARKNRILLYSLDYHCLTLHARILKNCRIPDIYRGKGIKFKKEVLRFKAGKQR